MSRLPTPESARRGEHPYRRAQLASEAVVARYLNDISGRRRRERTVKSSPGVRPTAQRLAA